MLLNLMANSVAMWAPNEEPIKLALDIPRSSRNAFEKVVNEEIVCVFENRFVFISEST